MKQCMCLASCVVSLVALAPLAHATSYGLPPPSGNTSGDVTAEELRTPWRCRRADMSPCAPADLADRSMRHIVILSSGFATDEALTFWDSFDKIIRLMTGANQIWSTQKKNQLLFVGWFEPSGPIDSPTAAFSASIPEHPSRGRALSLVTEPVYAKIDAMRGTLPSLTPMGALVVFNYSGERVTATASAPSFVNRPYGIAKMTLTDIGPDGRGYYIPAHELGHAALNFVDEYIEDGFEKVNIRSVDVIMPLASFDGSWVGFRQGLASLLDYYDLRFSEILANNGSDNISTVRYPATVSTPGVVPEDYAKEGGMFFGLGTFHQDQPNLMWEGDSQHSSSQQRVIDEAFGAPATRPNDRLRAAGPGGWWPATLGATTKVMISDGDKRHHYHPTRSYTVQVAWLERQWRTCYKWGAIPYPCYSDVWKYAEKTVPSTTRRIQLKLSLAYGLAILAQKVACAVGYDEFTIPPPSAEDETPIDSTTPILTATNIVTATGSAGEMAPTGPTGTVIPICDQDLANMAGELMPTMVFPLPFQEISIPASQWMTTYYWRFRSDNGRYQSGFTGWSSFFRSL